MHAIQCLWALIAYQGEEVKKQGIEESQTQEDSTQEARIMLEDMRGLYCRITKIDPDCKIIEIIQENILYRDPDTEVMKGVNQEIICERK